MKTAFRTSRVRKQSGLTLLELMVALGLGLIVVTIAATALLLGQRGYRAVDATTALGDRQRFATDLISRVVVQAGFQDFGSANVGLRSTATALGIDPEPDIYGWNNAVYKKPDDLFLSTGTKITTGNRPGDCGSTTDTSCQNGSDVLVIRFQGVSTASGGKTADNTMINCAGQGEAGLVTGDLNDRAISMFHVARGTNGEPALYCSYYVFNPTGSTLPDWSTPQPMIEGVETFQVLYGTDGVTAATIPSAAAGAQNSVADRWLRADQLTVAGNPAATRENWRRVRAVKIGMVLRAPIGSAPQSATATFAPLGSLYSSSDDFGTSLVASADNRLRMVSNMSVHLRNDLTLR